MSEYLFGARGSRAEDPSRVGLVQLALPLILEHILFSTVNLLDVLFISRISDHAVNSVSVPGQYLNICQMLAGIVATGTIVCVNQAIGMRNFKKVNELATIAAAANILLGLLFGALFFFLTPTMLSIMRLEADTLEGAARYMRLTGSLMIFQCVSMVFNSLSRSMGHIRAPLFINVVMNVINIVGNYAVVFHPEITGLDPVTGVALTSVLSQFAGMTISCCVAYRAGVRVSPRALKPFPKRDVMLSLSIGIPGGLNNISYSLCQLVTTAIIAMAGDVMVSAKVYVSNILGYIALVSIALCEANSIMVGYRAGKGDYRDAKKLALFVMKTSVLLNVFFSLVLFALKKPLLRIFTADAQILAIASGIFLIDFVVEIGRALNTSLAGSLSAVGDVRFQLVVNQSSGWLISVGCSYLLGIVFGLKLYGVWMAFALDECARGLILLYRWKSEKWVSGAERRKKTIAE